MSEPYEYSVARLDDLIENLRKAKKADYGAARSALWEEIQKSQEWHRKAGSDYATNSKRDVVNVLHLIHDVLRAIHARM